MRSGSHSYVVVMTGPPLPKAALNVIRSEGIEVRQLPSDLAISELLESLNGADYYVLGGSEYLTEEFFAKSSPRLMEVCFYGTGYDGFIDVEAAERWDIRLSFTPHANVSSTVEYSLAMILAGVRDLFGYSARTSRSDWSLHTRPSLSRSTVGVVGFGHVGQGLVKLLRSSFSVTPLVWNRTNRSAQILAAGAITASLEEIFARCNVISIHADWPNNRSDHLVTESHLGKAAENLVLVNCARARAVDPIALFAFLQSHPHATALFDGYYIEPISPQADPHGLLKLGEQRFTLTPHAAYLSNDSELKMAEMLVACIRAARSGRPSPFPIPRERIHHEERNE